MEGFHKIQAVYPNAKGGEPPAKLCAGVFAGEMEVTVPLLQHKANALIIGLIVVKVLLNVIIEAADIGPGAVLADEPSPGEELEYLFGPNHGLTRINQGVNEIPRLTKLIRDAEVFVEFHR